MTQGAISSRRETVYQFLAVTIGGVAVASLPFFIAIALASGMVFDPPGSSEDVGLRWTFRLMLLFPVAVAFTAHLAFGSARQPSGQSLATMMTPLASWFLALGALEIAL